MSCVCSVWNLGFTSPTEAPRAPSWAVSDKFQNLMSCWEWKFSPFLSSACQTATLQWNHIISFKHIDESCASFKLECDPRRVRVRGREEPAAKERRKHSVGCDRVSARRIPCGGAREVGPLDNISRVRWVPRSRWAKESSSFQGRTVSSWWSLVEGSLFWEAALKHVV